MASEEVLGEGRRTPEAVEGERSQLGTPASEGVLLISACNKVHQNDARCQKGERGGAHGTLPVPKLPKPKAYKI